MSSRTSVDSKQARAMRNKTVTQIIKGKGNFEDACLGKSSYFTSAKRQELEAAAAAAEQVHIQPQPGEDSVNQGGEEDNNPMGKSIYIEKAKKESNRVTAVVGDGGEGKTAIGATALPSSGRHVKETDLQQQQQAERSGKISQRGLMSETGGVSFTRKSMKETQFITGGEYPPAPLVASTTFWDSSSGGDNAFTMSSADS